LVKRVENKSFEFSGPIAAVNHGAILKFGAARCAPVYDKPVVKIEFSGCAHARAAIH
jgi:hypothetical protein